jgi:hypothetical protein
MKAKIMLWVLAVGLGAAFGFAALPGGPDPALVSRKARPVDKPASEGGPHPICRPGIPCAVEK